VQLKDPDHYLTLAGPSTGELRDRGSKFLAYAFPLLEENDWQIHLDDIRKAHPKASHHCFAFRLGLDKNHYRANDDGEPSGTAGRPILGQIDSLGLTNVLVVVVRYFGGTLLGTAGLINAYRDSAAEALKNAELLEKSVETVFFIEFHYAMTSPVMNALKKLGLRPQNQTYSAEGSRLEIAILKSKVEDTFLQFKAWVMDISVEEAAGLEQVAGVEWGGI
jgi:uncharacterized YigZ family protein